MWSDNETTEDLLGFKVHADLIKELVLEETLLPLTIGITGDWGSGKSSVMKILQRDIELLDSDNQICLYFNGWMFEGYDDAKAALIESILFQLENHKKIKSKIEESLIGSIKGLFKSVDWFRAGGLLLKNVALPAISAYATGGLSLIPDTLKNISEFLSSEKLSKIVDQVDDESVKKTISNIQVEINNQNNFNEIPKTVREFRNKFEKFLDQTNIKSLVILIDDLDRCTPDRIIDNLEAIKLFLNVKGTAFVIGADKRIVRHAIESRYKTMSFNSSEITDYEKLVTDYIEKLIQIPYEIPKLSKSDVETYLSLLICKRDLDADRFEDLLKKYAEFRKKDKHTAYSLESIKKELNDKTPEDLSIILQISSIITENLKGNPRQIKRFLNAFMLRKKLGKVANFNLMNDVLVKLMALEYSKPALFEDLNSWQQAQDGRPKEMKYLEEIINASDTKEKFKESAYQNWNDPSVIKWFKMEPNLVGVDLGDYFWITRDKLSDSIAGGNLFPIYIRELYQKLYEYTTDADLRSIIDNELKDISENAQQQLFEYIKKNLLAHPDDERNIDIFYMLIEKQYLNALPILLLSLRSCDQNQLKPGCSVKIKNLIEKFSNETNNFINEINKETKFGKALQQYLKKQDD